MILLAVNEAVGVGEAGPKSEVANHSAVLSYPLNGSSTRFRITICSSRSLQPSLWVKHGAVVLAFDDALGEVLAFG